MTEDKLWWENIKVSLQNKTKEQKLFHSLLNTLSAEHYFQKGKKYLTLKVPSALYQNFLQKFLPAISFQIQKHGFEKKIQVCKDKEFSKTREEILEMIWNMEEEIMGRE